MMTYSTIVHVLLCHVIISASNNSLDGSKLSDRLKEITDSTGLTYMQDIYNNLPFIEKTGDGKQLLQDIRDNIESSLTDLTLILKNIQSKVLQHENEFTTEATLPMCCQIQLDFLTYDPKFRHEVNFSTACVTKSPIIGHDIKYPPAELGTAMKINYNNNKNVLWQHYGTKDGTSIIYPATHWTDCNSYDPRLRSAFAATTSPRNKDIVIMIDSSSSMKIQSGVIDKSKFVLVKEAARIVLQTLNPNDRVAVLSFNSDVKIPAECYSDTLSFATNQNIAKLKEFVSVLLASSSSESNFEKGLNSAFFYFETSDNMNETSREQVILFISDGSPTQGQDPRTVIREENMKLQNKVIIFTYLLGPDVSSNDQSLLRDMATQIQSNGSYGSIREGQFSYFDANNHARLAMDMATFYMHLQDGVEQSKPTYSVPYVDPFAEVGLMTSMCLPVTVTVGFYGVVCTDVKLSELLKDVEFFEEGNSSYAFMIDKSGRALVHPLLPDATYARLHDDPVQVDITTLERSPNSGEIIEKMKSGVVGSKMLPAVYFTIPRGALVNDGRSIRIINATFYWGPISNTNFFIFIVLGYEESYSEISEIGFKVSSEDLANGFMYHDRSLTLDNFQDCKFISRLVTLDRSSVKFAPSAFKNPFQYTDKDETSEDVSKYKKYFTKKTDENPGFKATIRPDVWATYQAEKFWKQHKSNHLSWRYIGTPSGIMRIYPGVSLKKTYDHEKRPWYRQTMAHPGMIFLTTPYNDAWGSGILISQVHTIYKANSKQIAAVVGSDFPLQYFHWFLDQIYPSCSSHIYRCMIIDDNGFIVMHPTFKESTNADKFLKSIHITVEEPALAKLMTSKNILNRKECQDYSVNKELRSYRITLPSGHPDGLSFADMDGHVELRPIPSTNIFIIRQRTDSSLSSECTCDSGITPDFRMCVQCDCLCYKPILFDICKNMYSRDGNLPCTARIPDPSGTSIPEDLTGLPTCYSPQCHTKRNKSECFSEAECGWCEFTDEGKELNPKCCRLKEDCSFGKTRPTNRDTCGATTTSDPNANQRPTPDPIPPKSSDNTAAIVGASAATGIVLTLLIIGIVYLIRTKKICCDKFDKTDPYIDAIHDAREPSGDYIFVDNEGTDLSSSSSDFCSPPPYAKHSNEYTNTTTTFNDNN